MLDSLRKPFFFLALVLIAIVVLIECGSSIVASINPKDSPGYAIRYMAFLDGLVLFTVSLMGMSLLIPHRVHGRVQGITTLVFSLIILIFSVLMILSAIVLLILMVSLLLAVPFGTIVYMAKFSDFAVETARGTLALLMALKLGFAVMMVLAHQRFLQNKGLVLIIFTSLLANILISFLHEFVPTILMNITDDIAAIVVTILAALWAIFFLIGSIPAVIKALRVDRALT